MDRFAADSVAGDLGHASNAIAAELDKVRGDGEAYNRRLLQRSRELAAIAAVAQAISIEQLDLAGTLERTLQVVLEVTGLPAGWVMLLPEDGGEAILASSVGLSPEVAEKQAVFQSPECECGKVLDSRQPLVVHPLHTACPIRALNLGDGQAPTCHAAVPLLNRSKVLGVLNLAGDDPSVLDAELLTLLGAIGQQLGLAIENARLWEELKQRDLLRGQLLEQAIAAQEEERRRVARELHDQTGQALTSILVWLRALEAEADGAEGVVVGPARLQELKAIVVDTLDGVRELAVELRPSVLDDLGLVPAVQHAVRICHERHGLMVDFEALGLQGVRLPPSIETALYRIAQEALTNVVQHACANKVSLLLEGRAGAVILIVEDDGCGFDANRLMHGPLDEHWLGLSGMRERAELLGGRLTIESAQGSGTAVFVEIPLPDDRPRRARRGDHGK
jgi:signal transduction histidine kinase